MKHLLQSPGAASAADGADQAGPLSRRQFVQAGSGALAGSILAKGAFAAPRPIRIGYVSPLTGALAAFGEADQFVVGDIRKRLQGGAPVAGGARQVEILVRDCQSNSNRAAEVAAQLIKSDKIDLMLVSSTPDTVNPVADQCELNGVPCISNDAPWQAYFFGRGGKPEKGFEWTYHFHHGMEIASQVMCDIFSLLPTNKRVGLLFGNDIEGNLFSDPVKGFPPTIRERGFTPYDPGRFQISATDFSAQISAFKRANAQILYGVTSAPIFSNFWMQAAQQGYRPKIVVIGKALLMPAGVSALGPLGKNLMTDVWWSPAHPFHSGLTGQSARQYCEAYEAATGRQWLQALGFRHALFEVAMDVFKRTRNPESPQAVIEAVRATRYKSIAGPIQWQGPAPNPWTSLPVKNVCTTPLVSGQWVPGKKWPYDLVVVDSRHYPTIPVQRKAQPIA